MVYRLFKIIIVVILGLVLITFAFAAWLTSTTPGNRELSYLANIVEPRLEVDIRGGSLLNGVKAHKVSWTDEFINISASQVNGEWNPACFLKRTLCADTIQLETLNIKTRPKDDKKRTGSITIPEIKLPIDLAFHDLQVSKLVVDYSDSAVPIEIENIKLSASNRGKEVAVKQLSAMYKNISANASGEIDLNENIILSLSLNAIIEDVFEEHDLVFQGSTNGPLDNLYVTGSSAGAFESTFTSNINALAANFPSKARINWKSAGWPLMEHNIVNSSDGSLFLDGSTKQYMFDFDSHINGEDIPESVVKVHGALTPGGIISDTLEVNTLGGRISGKGSVNWADWKNAIVWSSELNFSDLDPSAYRADLSGSLAGSVFASGTVNRDKTWQLDLKPAVIQGAFNKHPIHAHAILQRSDNAQWDIESLRLISKDNEFNVEGRVADEWAMNGELRLSKLQQLLPEASGSILGTIALSGPVKQVIADFDLHSAKLLWRENSVEDLALSGEINYLLNNNSKINFKAKNLIVSEQRVDALKLEFTGKKQLHNIRVNAEAFNNTSAAFTLDGELLDNYDWKGKLFHSTLNLPGHVLNLAEQIGLNFDKSNNALKVSPHCWSNSETNICLNNTLNASKSGRAEISLSPYSMHQLNGFLPDTVRLFGQGKAEIELDWGEQVETGFRAIVNAEVNNGSLLLESQKEAKDLKLEYKKLKIDTFLDRGDLRSNIILDSENLGTADISFSVRPDIKPLSFTRGTLKLSNLDIRFLQPFLPDFQTIEGTITADGKITGAVIDPAFVGDITLSDPILKSDKLPLQITGGGIKAAIAGRKANIQGNVNSGNGEIKLYGEADWEDLAAWSLVVNAQGDALVINQKPLFESVVESNIVVSIKPNQVNVGGNAKIVAAAINIKEIPEGATNLSPDIVLADDGTEEALSKSNWEISSDVTIVLGDAIRLSGYGMRAQLKGDFRVVKTNNKPLQLFGEIDIPEGIYKSYGQDLKVVDGQVIFVGPISQSNLNIDAYRSVEDVKAGLHLSGTLEKPSVTLYSEPFLEQERILAYIVLGRDISAGDNNDSNILATAALSMGISNGRGLATDIAEAFGIQEFNIEASGRGEDTQVLLSGRISERLLIRYGVGVFTPVNTLYLRYDLTKELYLETVQGLEQAADLIYSFEF